MESNHKQLRSLGLASQIDPGSIYFPWRKSEVSIPKAFQFLRQFSRLGSGPPEGLFHIGTSAWTRTKILGFKARCPTIRRL